MFSVGAADEAGRLVTRFFAPQFVQGHAFLFQAFDFSGCAISNVLAHTF